MVRRIGMVSLLASIGGFALIGPSGAGAATTLGETFLPDDCASDTYIQTADPGNRYMVPSDGVITSWSYRSDPTPTAVARFKVARTAPGADLSADTADVTIVGQSAAEFPAPDTLNTYPTQISVKAGDRIGEFVEDDCSRQDDAYTDHFFEADVQPGTTETFSRENFQQDISAVLEPDCDKDGLGDETQDPHTKSCQPPATGQRDAALKRCKKNAKKKQWTKKKLRKCKRKARKLPL
jgi:hypothetical protein